jgi:hypothetical protein
MTEDGHLQAVDELRGSLASLQVPEDIRAYTELSWGIAFHLLAIGAQRRHGIHRVEHQGLGRWLRERGHVSVADAFGQMENLRAGRWYGRQGNGHAAAHIDELLEQIETWALAKGSA